MTWRLLSQPCPAGPANGSVSNSSDRDVTGCEMQTVSEIWIGGVVFGWLTIRGEMGFYYKCCLAKLANEAKSDCRGKTRSVGGLMGQRGQ